MAGESSSLVRRMRRGDAQALARFIALNRQRLLAVVEQKLGPALRRRIEPDDIVQEVSVEAIRTLATSLKDDGEPFNWLCQLAERRVIDAHRRLVAQKRDVRREQSLAGGSAEESRRALADVLAASVTTPTRALSRKGHAARLAAALSMLPEDHQEALRLRYVEGQPSKEIASRLNKSDGAVRVMLSRALDRLKRALGPKDEK